LPFQVSTAIWTHIYAVADTALFSADAEPRRLNQRRGRLESLYNTLKLMCFWTPFYTGKGSPMRQVGDYCLNAEVTGKLCVARLRQKQFLYIEHRSLFRKFFFEKNTLYCFCNKCFRYIIKFTTRMIILGAVFNTLGYES
jgi:hypothetical protein